jgi:hypothetical protein
LKIGNDEGGEIVELINLAYFGGPIEASLPRRRDDMRDLGEVGEGRPIFEAELKVINRGNIWTGIPRWERYTDLIDEERGRC